MAKKSPASRMMPEETAVQTKLPSAITFRRHPVHPMLVHFPVAFLNGAVVTDSVFLWSEETFWAHMSFWLIAAGATMGVLAAIAGTAEFLLVPAIRLHTAAWGHFLAGITLLAFATANLMLRIDDHLGTVEPWGIFLSVTTLAILALAASLGGKLVYHYLIGTGVGEAEQSV